MIFHPVPERQWQIVDADYFMNGGKDYLLIVDYFSKYPELVEERGKTSETTINVMKSVFAWHGIPEKLVADNMPFNSTVFQRFAKQWDTRMNIFFPASQESLVDTIASPTPKVGTTDRNVSAHIDYLRKTGGRARKPDWTEENDATHCFLTK